METEKLSLPISDKSDKPKSIFESSVVDNKQEEVCTSFDKSPSRVKSLKELTFEKVYHFPVRSETSATSNEVSNNCIVVDDIEETEAYSNSACEVSNNCIVIDDIEETEAYSNSACEGSSSARASRSDCEVELVVMEVKCELSDFLTPEDVEPDDSVQEIPVPIRKKHQDSADLIEIADSPLSVCIDIDNTSTSTSTATDDVVGRENFLINKTKDFTIPCLQTLFELERKCKGQALKLNLESLGEKVKRKHTSMTYYASYKRKKDLLLELEQWESTLNECSRNEPYISVENKVDNSRPPKDFVYVAKTVFRTTNVDHLFDQNYLVGCSCERCTPNTCDCPHNSGGKFAYDRCGRVQFEPGQPIYECNARCSCSISCRNRVVQRGRTVRVTIFRTPNRCGWGVKTMDFINRNQFVTEYVGELITNEVAEERGQIYDDVGQTYLFDLDYNDGDCLYTIDAKNYGNISHFINHSCDPNLSVYGVWIDTLDPTLPRIALFAARDIQPGEELTFDYLMTGNDSSPSSPSSSPLARMSPRKANRMKCRCGAKNCRTYLY